MGDLFNTFANWAGFAAGWGHNPQGYTPPITGNQTDQTPTALLIGGAVGLLLILILLYFIFR